jgi:hypothetical protein
MKGRAFLDLARTLVRGTTEVYCRATAIHAYYALVLECRDAQARWGFPLPPHHNVHATVRLRFVYASDLDLQQIAKGLDWLIQRRNRASYNLSPSPLFASAAEAQLAVQKATDADSARLAAAQAAIRP